MAEIRLAHDYLANDQHRTAFNRLLDNVFGFSLEEFYQLGYLDSWYVPFSLFLNDTAIANVSASRFTLMLDGKPRRAVQIGTVMTHPEYRGRGHAATLMKQVIETYKADTDLFFLFANNSTFDFYPRFDFQQVTETHFSLALQSDTADFTDLEQLDLNDEEIRATVRRFVKQRVPVSNRFGVLEGEDIFLFHAMYLVPDSLFKLSDPECLLFMQWQGTTLHLYDIISHKPVSFAAIQHAIPVPPTSDIIFHFTPDKLGLMDHPDLEQQPITPDEDAFFVRSATPLFASPFQRPRTLEA